MQIIIDNLGRKFGKEWIFRNFHARLLSGQSYAVTGANGSGKSTLLQILAGVIPGTEGTITYQSDQKIIEPDAWFRCISIAAPYQELIEEFTLTELINFHRRFKSTRNFSTRDLLEKVYLETSRNKPVKNLSSGMKQRLKLGLAIYSDTPVLMLDEPTTNLDSQGIRWYQQMIRENVSDRLVIICSNQSYEYEFCQHQLHIRDNQVEIT
jgi:ABC-type multidrug transport system ATPase subunit